MPHGQSTRELIAAEGLWTDSPAANFITIARQDDETINVNKLAGRSVRTFLGQRIDCGFSVMTIHSINNGSSIILKDWLLFSVRLV